MHFETLFSKHNKYILNILQHIIWSQRLQNVFNGLEVPFKNMSKWIRGDLYTDQIKYITQPQVHTIINGRRAMNELMDLGVNTDNVQCYNKHQ